MIPEESRKNEQLKRKGSSRSKRLKTFRRADGSEHSLNLKQEIELELASMLGKGIGELLAVGKMQAQREAEASADIGEIGSEERREFKKGQRRHRRSSGSSAGTWISDGGTGRSEGSLVTGRGLGTGRGDRDSLAAGDSKAGGGGRKKRATRGAAFHKPEGGEGGSAPEGRDYMNFLDKGGGHHNPNSMRFAAKHALEDALLAVRRDDEATAAPMFGSIEGELGGGGEGGGRGKRVIRKLEKVFSMRRVDSPFKKGGIVPVLGGSTTSEVEAMM